MEKTEHTLSETATPAAISAIILAAGLSTRMGALKQLLPLGDSTLIGHVVELYRAAGISDIHVVVGHRADEIRKTQTALPVNWVMNEHYKNGMFSSICTGLRDLPQRCSAFFIHPVDIPLVRFHTIARLVAAHIRTPALIQYPLFSGERGHPPLISAGLIPGILDWSGEGGLRPFLDRIDARQVREVPVADEAILLDSDTPEAYERIRAGFSGRSIPSEAECRELMDNIVRLPENVQRHCYRVAENAEALGRSLSTVGVHLDLRLIRAAAMLHDIARSEKGHAEAGARLLECHGFSSLSPIVGVHMDLEVNFDGPIDESQIVHLADKLAAGDQPVDLETRFDKKLKKYGADPKKAAAIFHRQENARRILGKVERLTGRSVMEIIRASSKTSD
jgi:molybdenum cofactor cytidylyltransferase